MKKLIPVLLFTLLISKHTSIAQTWLQLNDFPSTERDDGASFTIGTISYCGTGLTPWFSTTTDFYSFNSNTEVWSPIAALPNGMERQYASGFSDGQYGYIFGGTSGNNYFNDLWQYNPSNNSWQSKTPMPAQGRMGASVFVINDTAYVISGKSSNQNSINEMWAYSFTGNNWINKGPLPFGGRWRASTTSVNGLGYLIFGKDSTNYYHNELYQFNPLNNSWSLLNNFPLPGRTYSVMQNLDDDLLIFGGIDSLGNSYNDLWSFDLDALQWNELAQLPASPRRGGMGFTGQYAFYYTCGINQNNSRLKETWKIDYATLLKHETLVKNILVYPNPFKDLLTIELPEKAQSIEIQLINTMGEIIYTANISSNTNLSMQHLPNGIYFLKMGYESKWVYQKIIKN
jgi:N-acetylneuraminic acid mutarotase